MESGRVHGSSFVGGVGSSFVCVRELKRKSRSSVDIKFIEKQIVDGGTGSGPRGTPSRPRDNEWGGRARSTSRP